MRRRILAFMHGPGTVPGERLTTWIFLRALGLVYLSAFLSLWVQIQGLAGSRGILPAAEFLHAAAEQLGASRFHMFPTLLWTGAGDGALTAWCAAGTVLSVLLVLGFAPVPVLLGLWAVYLSLATVCRDFLWFQWDGLLLEAGFLAVFLAPLRLWSRPKSNPPPSFLSLFLLRWLLFRLMISSAAVKILSGDPAWRHLTALRFHYETQPLPPWTAWYAHHLPGPVHTACAAGMFAIEGVAPLLIWGPRRVRFFGAGLIALLQVVILATGNYGFFNWLTLALCLLLLDDGVWPRASRPDGETLRTRSWPSWVPKAVAFVMIPLSLIPFLGTLRIPTGWLDPFPDVYDAVAPFRTVNSYGLFAVMTVNRPEIIVEGSDDRVTWRPYAFRYKPGDPGRRPPFAGPHMPRLDWQMWFAALDRQARREWFLRFCRALLQGSPSVLGLLAENPFPDHPPRFVRTMVYDYRFSDPATRRKTGDWWVRTRTGPYCPVLTLEDGKLTTAGYSNEP